MRATHHFVFLLVPRVRIRGSNNLSVCEETGAIARGGGHSEVREGERDGGRSSAGGEERDLPFSLCVQGESRVRLCVRLPEGPAGSRVARLFFFFFFWRVLSFFFLNFHPSSLPALFPPVLPYVALLLFVPSAHPSFSRSRLCHFSVHQLHQLCLLLTIFPL